MTQTSAALYPDQRSVPRLRPIPIHCPSEPRPFSLEPVVDLLRKEGFDSDPYGEFCHSQGQIAVVARRFRVDRQWVYRGIARGIDAYAADAVAIRLGVHPVVIWPDWFSYAPDDEEVAIAAKRAHKKAYDRDRRARAKSRRRDHR